MCLYMKYDPNLRFMNYNLSFRTTANQVVYNRSTTELYKIIQSHKLSLVLIFVLQSDTPHKNILFFMHFREWASVYRIYKYLL